MDLASYLLKPVQRMGKYALLLQQLVKACSGVQVQTHPFITSEHFPHIPSIFQGPALQDIQADVEELQRAEEMVKFQLRHGNDLLAMDSLRDCDVNVKEQGRLLRQNEFLVWQGRGGKKCLRQVFLFEDLVLFSKARRFPDHKVSPLPLPFLNSTIHFWPRIHVFYRILTSTSIRTVSKHQILV